MRWFKLHTDIIRHPSTIELDDHTFRLFIGLLCLASDSDTRGTITSYRPRGLALTLCTDEARLTQALDAMADLGIIEQVDGAIVIPSWEQRQRRKPSDSPKATAERKRQSRQKNGDSADVTPLSRGSHAPVTPPVTRQIRVDESRSEEERIDQIPLSGGVGGEAEVLRTGGGGDKQAAAERLMASYPTSVQKRRGVAAFVALLEAHDEDYLAAKIEDYTSFCRAKKRKFLDAHRWCESGAYADDLRDEIRQAQIDAIPTFSQQDLERQVVQDPRVWKRYDAFTYRDTPMYRLPSQAPIPDGWQLVRAASLGRREPAPSNWPRTHEPSIVSGGSP